MCFGMTKVEWNSGFETNIYKLEAKFRGIWSGLAHCVLDNVLLFRGRDSLELQLPFNSYFLHRWFKSFCNRTLLRSLSWLTRSQLSLKSIALFMSIFLGYIVSFEFSSSSCSKAFVFAKRNFVVTDSVSSSILWGK